MKILIIKPSSLGDVVHSLPFLKAVKDSFPEVRIDWVISSNLKGLIDGNPLIDRLIPLNKDSWKPMGNLPGTLQELISLRKTLRSGHYDMVVDLQGLLRSGIITSFASAPLKIGLTTAREGSRYFYNRVVAVNGSIHAVDRYMEVAKAIGARMTEIEFPIHIDNAARENVLRLLNGAKEYIVIVPSARWVTKRWPVESFASLVAGLPVPCVITGSSTDKEIAEEIKDRLQTVGGDTANIIDLCGRTDLKGLVALIAGAKAVVGNDSGPIHIAAALNVPVVALFGPTDPERTGPYGWQRDKDRKVIRVGVSCSPCFRKRCREPICMSSISVERVAEEVREYL